VGDPRQLRKTYSTPKHPFEKQRIERENEIVKQFGLKNKKEVWKAETKVRNYRKQARQIQADVTDKKKQKEEELLGTLRRKGLIQDADGLDAALSLTAEDMLNRRLQTVVFKKGMGQSIKQSRQFITHGHIAVDKTKTTIPGYAVSLAQETKIKYHGEQPKTQESKTQATVEEPKPMATETAPQTKPTVPKAPGTKPAVPKKGVSE